MRGSTALVQWGGGTTGLQGCREAGLLCCGTRCGARAEASETPVLTGDSDVARIWQSRIQADPCCRACWAGTGPALASESISILRHKPQYADQHKPGLQISVRGET